MPSDRNLVFGIIAVQLNFVKRDALLAAMAAWILEKHRPIGDVLRQHGALTADRQQLLDSLVDEHLRDHQGDPEKSLVALSASLDLQRTLGALNDPDLQASLIAFGKGADEQMTTDWAHKAGPRFRVLRPHARGGLGEVFVAEDQELHREVALKEMQERHANNASSKARFLLEAEITAGLEHPSIVPVYGLGAYEDGRPFYAMRFIRGESLKEAIGKYHSSDAADASKQNVLFRQLLRRFIDVCNAVGYAHSRGILHRDLKPANIMLGKFGETLVVDWGLAKATGSRSADQFPQADEQTLLPSSGSSMVETQAGSAIGTLGYMSPEQAAGRLDELGPASDVYSLGATLHCILVGTSPTHGMDQPAALRLVQSGGLPSPRQVKSNVPYALDAICTKAMSVKPQDRYAGALQMAQDIEQWLADEPVSVHREPLIDRLRRRARKHRTMVTAATVLLVTAVVALAITVVLVEAQRRKTVDAESKTQQALNDVTAEKERVDKARQLAEAHRTEFVRHLSLLAALSQQFKMAGTNTEEQFELLQKANRSSAEKLLATVPEDPEFKEARMQLHRSIATAATNLNDHRASIEHHQRGRALLAEEIGPTPSASQAVELAVSYSAEAWVHSRSGDDQTAELRLREADKYLRLAADQGYNSSSLSSFFSQQANLYAMIRNDEAQLVSLEEALRQRKLTTKPPQFDTALTSLRRSIASCLYRLGKNEECEKLLLEAAEIAEREELAQSDLGSPSGVAANNQAMNCYETLELHFLRQGKFELAVEWRAKSHQLRVRMAEARSDQYQYQAFLARSHENCARLESHRSIAKAIEHQERGIAILEALEKAGKLRGAAFHEAALRRMKADLTTLKLVPKALNDLSFIFDQPAELHLTLLSKRLEAMSYRHDANGALTTAQAFDRLSIADELVSAAHACALASRYFDGEAAKTLREQSIQFIKRGINAGYSDVAKLSRDLDLQPIWSNAEFKKLTEVKRKSIE